MFKTADGGLMRPADYLPTARRVRLRSSRTCTGSLVLGSNFDQRVEFESKLERDAILTMSARCDVESVLTQCPRVAYIGADGKPRKYTFDLRVTLTSGEVVAVEVKPEIYVEKRGVRALLALIAAQMPRAVADRVSLVTERDLDAVTVSNAELIHASRFSDPIADEQARMALARATGAVSVAEIARGSGLGPRTVSAVARLIRAGEVRLERHEHIGMGARVHATAIEISQGRKAA